MKKLFTLIAAFAAVATMANAQGLKFAVEGGLHINEPSSFSKDALKEAVNTGNSLGFFIGPKLMFNAPLGFGVDGAILFSQKYNDMGEKEKALQYIDIPINARYQINIGGLLGIYAALGPQLSVNIGDRDWSLSDFGEAQSLGKQYFEASKANISLNLGAGVIVLKRIQAGFTYNVPITRDGKSLYNISSTDVVGDVNQVKSNFKNNTWSIRAAYIF